MRLSKSDFTPKSGSDHSSAETRAEHPGLCESASVI